MGGREGHRTPRRWQRSGPPCLANRSRLSEYALREGSVLALLGGVGCAAFRRSISLRAPRVSQTFDRLSQKAGEKPGWTIALIPISRQPSSEPCSQCCRFWDSAPAIAMNTLPTKEKKKKKKTEMLVQVTRAAQRHTHTCARVQTNSVAKRKERKKEINKRKGTGQSPRLSRPVAIKGDVWECLLGSSSRKVWLEEDVRRWYIACWWSLGGSCSGPWAAMSSSTWQRGQRRENGTKKRKRCPPY